jgi:phage shock protein PspC (stress-responsive transcriptional regulator)
MNRRLYRSRTDTVLGGVAAGLATYLNADPALVRIAWAILVPLTGGAAFLAYVVAWIVVPEEPAPIAGEPASWVDAADPGAPAATEPGTPVAATRATAAEPRPAGRAGVVVGVGLVLLGVWFLVREYLPPIDWDLLWPVILIGIGALVLISSSRRRTDV